jgi:hypothetical protein
MAQFQKMDESFGLQGLDALLKPLYQPVSQLMAGYGYYLDPNTKQIVYGQVANGDRDKSFFSFTPQQAAQKAEASGMKVNANQFYQGASTTPAAVTPSAVPPPSALATNSPQQSMGSPTAGAFDPNTIAAAMARYGAAQGTPLPMNARAAPQQQPTYGSIDSQLAALRQAQYPQVRQAVIGSNPMMSYAQGTQGSVADTMHQLNDMERYGQMTGDAHVPALVGMQEGIVNKEAMQHGGNAIVEMLNNMFPNTDAPAPRGPIPQYASGKDLRTPDDYPSTKPQAAQSSPDQAKQNFLATIIDAMAQTLQKVGGPSIPASENLTISRPVPQPAPDAISMASPGLPQGNAIGLKEWPPAMPPFQGTAPQPSGSGGTNPAVPAKAASVTPAAATPEQPSQYWTRNANTPSIDMSKVDMSNPQTAMAQIYNAITAMNPSGQQTAMTGVEPVLKDAMEQKRIDQQLAQQGAQNKIQSEQLALQGQRESESERHNRALEEASILKASGTKSAGSKLYSQYTAIGTMLKNKSAVYAKQAAASKANPDIANKNTVMSMLYANPNMLKTPPDQILAYLQGVKGPGLFGLVKGNKDAAIKMIQQAQADVIKDPQIATFTGLEKMVVAGLNDGSIDPNTTTASSAASSGGDNIESLASGMGVNLQ